ncbi:putative ribonuclease H-like domain-containing protein [Tanacetum coccineum]
MRTIDLREFVDDTDFNMDFGSEIPTDGLATIEMVNATKESYDEDDLAKFQELLLDAEKPLYKGYPDFTKLSAIVKLLNLKGKYGAFDKFFTKLLGLLKKMLPAGNEMKDNKELTVCLTCGISRWKVDNMTHKVYENIQAKLAPNPLIGEQTYNEVQHIKNKWGKEKRTNNKTSENQEDTRGRGGKIQKQNSRKTTEDEGSSNQVNKAYWKKLNIWYRKLRKEISLQELDKLQLELVVTLCLLEKFFPSSFFDIMIHLTVHLTREVIKGHVRNKNRPEGCIAEETIKEETIKFFSKYHKTMKTIGIPPDKHITNENEDGKPLSAGKASEVSEEVFQKAHLYVIQNIDEIVPYIE